MAPGRLCVRQITHEALLVRRCAGPCWLAGPCCSRGFCGNWAGAALRSAGCIQFGVLEIEAAINLDQACQPWLPCLRPWGPHLRPRASYAALGACVAPCGPRLRSGGQAEKWTVGR